MATFIDYQDELKTCPYNRLHKVAARRYQAHVNECERRSNVKLKICQFNSTHRVPFEEYEQHLETCPDSKQLVREMVSTIAFKKEKKEEEERRKEENQLNLQLKDKDYYDDDDDWAPKERQQKFTLSAFKDNNKEEDILNKDRFVDSLVLQQMSKSERRRFYERQLEMQKEQIEEEKSKKKIEEYKPKINEIRVPKPPPGFGGIGRGMPSSSFAHIQDSVTKLEVKKEPEEPLSYNKAVKLGIGRGCARKPGEQTVIKEEKK